MSKRKPPRFVWVTRDTLYGGAYGLWLTKPKKDWLGSWIAGLTGAFLVDELCPEHFELLTGLALKPGECRRVAWRSPFLVGDAT